MSSKCYGAGKSTGMTKTTYGMGQKPSGNIKVTASAGQNSGTMRSGDPKGAPAMGKGK